MASCKQPPRGDCWKHILIDMANAYKIEKKTRKKMVKNAQKIAQKIAPKNCLNNCPKNYQKIC